MSSFTEREVDLPAGGGVLAGTLRLPEHAQGVVLFAHGSGSSRLSPRNRLVAKALADAGFATLLFDLLTAPEAAVDARTAHLRFDIPLLAQRLIAATDWVAGLAETDGLSLGYFGASTGAAAALIAASRRPEVVRAVASRGGRPDLAGPALRAVRAPTLLIVGGDDAPVIDLNRAARAELVVENALEIVPGASHLFEEPGALEIVTSLAIAWFRRHLGRRARPGFATPAA